MKRVVFDSIWRRLNYSQKSYSTRLLLTCETDGSNKVKENMSSLLVKNCTIYVNHNQYAAKQTKETHCNCNILRCFKLFSSNIHNKSHPDTRIVMDLVAEVGCSLQKGIIPGFRHLCTCQEFTTDWFWLNCATFMSYVLALFNSCNYVLYPLCKHYV